MMVYERIEPEGRCVSPDGHNLVEYFSWGSHIPKYVFCRGCGKRGTVVVFEDESMEP